MAYAHLWQEDRFPWRQDDLPPAGRDFDAARGLVYSVAIALVVVWLPILCVVSFVAG